MSAVVVARVAGRRVVVHKAAWLGAGTVVALVVGMVLSAVQGQLGTSVQDVVGTFLHLFGIDTSWYPGHGVTAEAITQIRFPRVVMSALVGASLALAGAVMQSIFQNPLAEPGVVGVSSGAAFGAALAITVGWAAGWEVAAVAFCGGLVATLLAYTTARSSGRTDSVTLLLTGIAVNAVSGAGLAFVMFAGDSASREQVIFWQMGSINGSRWSEVLVLLVIAVVAGTALLSCARLYDLLALGEREAGHLGVRVERLRVGSIVLVALLTGAAVAFVGVIAFVGLVIPHVVRLVVGPGHRTLLPLSAVLGAALLTWADLGARTLITGADLPIGMLTAVIGGPFFFWLVRRTRRTAL